MSADFFSAAYACLAATDPQAKCEQTQQLCARLADIAALKVPAQGRSLDQPGRPARPALVAPRDLDRRRLGTPAGHAALLHAIAHIEFNAINLAWDAVCRFGSMPDAYYRDWTRVAGEEAYHFGLLQTRLQQLGYQYGDFPAHNGLWEMALKTRDDVLVRMALVPRVLEARGLDVTPGIMQRLQSHGDADSVAILDIILRDEIGHVAIGTHWFRHLCSERGLDAQVTFRSLLARYLGQELRGPFHRAARLQAGFTAAELDDLETLQRRTDNAK